MAIFDDFLRKRKENYYSFSDRKRLKELIDKLSDGSFDFSTKFVEKLSKYESVDASTIKKGI